MSGMKKSGTTSRLSTLTLDNYKNWVVRNYSKMDINFICGLPIKNFPVGSFWLFGIGGISFSFTENIPVLCVTSTPASRSVSSTFLIVKQSAFPISTAIPSDSTICSIISFSFKSGIGQDDRAHKRLFL